MVADEAATRDKTSSKACGGNEQRGEAGAKDVWEAEQDGFQETSGRRAWALYCFNQREGIGGSTDRVLLCSAALSRQPAGHGSHRAQPSRCRPGADADADPSLALACSAREQGLHSPVGASSVPDLDHPLLVLYSPD